MVTIKNLLVCGSLLVSTIIFSQGTETRNLSSFSKLQVSGSLEAFLEKGNEESVKIVTEGVSTERVITDVKGNILKVELERGDYRNIKVKVYITYKSLDEIDKAGSGNLTCNSDLSSSDFKLNAGGSGNVFINKKIKAQQVTLRKTGSGKIKIGALETDDADLNSSGSGDFEVSDGNAKKQSIHLSGSGNFIGDGLKSEECIATISGSGNIDISVSQSLEGKISGSGNINYAGEAQVSKAGIVGSGRIHKR
jgi:hypothetical protein